VEELKRFKREVRDPATVAQHNERLGRGQIRIRCLERRQAMYHDRGEGDGTNGAVFQVGLNKTACMFGARGPKAFCLCHYISHVNATN
jgi:hypothetical protein